MEVMVAIAVLGTVGVAVLTLTHEALAILHRGGSYETRVGTAAELIGAVELWPREELAQRLGLTAQGPLLLSLEQLRPTLFRVSVLEPSTNTDQNDPLASRARRARVLLTTLVHRP